MATYQAPGVYTVEATFDYYVRQISTSVCHMVGTTQRGPLNVATAVTSWEGYVRTFGELFNGGYLPYAAWMFFNNGGRILWVTRVAHYTDIMDTATCTAVAATKTVKDRAAVAAHCNTGAGGDNLITWTAKTPGTAGNSLTVTLVESGAETPLSVSVAGNGLDITVNLATDADSHSTSIPSVIIAAVAASSAAKALVTATSSNTGVVDAVTKTSLATGTGGVDSLQISASSTGVWGNYVSVVLSNGSRYPSTCFNLLVYYKGMLRETYRDVSLLSTASNYVGTIINGKSNYIVVGDKTNGLGSATNRPLASTVALESGVDGYNGMTDIDYIGDLSNRTGIYATDAIPGPQELTLCVPGVSSMAVAAAAHAYCELRKVVFYIQDTPVGLLPQDVMDFVNADGVYSDNVPLDTTYAALYWPWIKITDPLTGNPKLVPPSGAVAGCYARNDMTHVFAAPAGDARGKIVGAVGIEYNAQFTDVELLYPNRINVIMCQQDPIGLAYGMRIDGQKTLTTQTSSVDRVNARRGMIWLEISIANATRFVMFQPNNPQTWNQIIRVIDPVMRQLKAEGWLYDYYLQCDGETNSAATRQQHQILTRVYTKVTPTAEFVVNEFVMTDLSTSFTEVYKTNVTNLNG